MTNIEGELVLCGKLATFMTRMRKLVKHYEYLSEKLPDNQEHFYKAKHYKEISEEFELLVKGK